MSARHEAHAIALDVLHEALRAALDDRQPIPCRTPGRTALWTSEAHEERAEAAEACQACPILDPCRAAGQFERFGVWGGRDVTVKPGKKLPPRTTTETKPRPALDPIACHGCGEMFTPSRTGHTYCRQACRTRLASAERRRKARKNTEKETTA